MAEDEARELKSPSPSSKKADQQPRRPTARRQSVALEADGLAKLQAGLQQAPEQAAAAKSAGEAALKALTSTPDSKQDRPAQGGKNAQADIVSARSDPLWQYFYLTAMAHKINKPFLAQVPLTTEEVFALFQKAKALPSMSFEKWPAFLLRELTHLSMAGGYMQGAGKVVAPNKKAKPAAKFTLTSGLKNLAADLTDSSTLATKSWKWTPPTLDAGAAEPTPHFITIRHGANILAVLFDAKGLRRWEHDPNVVEKDYAFDLPGGLTGTCTAIRLGTSCPDAREPFFEYRVNYLCACCVCRPLHCNRVLPGPNKYDYTLDVPGELINLADNPSVATVNIDSIFIHHATVEGKGTAEAYILYEVTTILASMPEGPGYVTRKRFSEFDLLHKLVKSS